MRNGEDFDTGEDEGRDIQVVCRKGKRKEITTLSNCSRGAGKGKTCFIGQDNNRASELTQAVPGDFVLVCMRSALTPNAHRKTEGRITPSLRTSCSWRMYGLWRENR